MSDTSIVAILASVGIMLTGTVTADAAALASAIQLGKPADLVGFVAENPDSEYAPDALLVASQILLGRLDDEDASTVNPSLTCRLSIAIGADGRAIVSWTSTGAIGMGISPLKFPEGIPASGERVLSAAEFLRFDMTVKDAAGNSAQCWVALPGKSIDTNSLSAPVSGAAPAPVIIISVM
jgi:hypothetical protein